MGVARLLALLVLETATGEASLIALVKRKSHSSSA
jgi:hypothetical protein